MTIKRIKNYFKNQNNKKKTFTIENFLIDLNVNFVDIKIVLQNILDVYRHINRLNAINIDDFDQTLSTKKKKENRRKFFKYLVNNITSLERYFH